ncbi:hypothetical protein UMC2_26311 [[Clostridium] sordellii]|uniref:hypothetical protein n=1 Tax=Paraclostridium sordellii TaxID=1505 RepID=UPI0005425647|nr:hypothetical protein [Paeniclostridium sordellii]CEK35738.1 hypothetical protein UMC2_26311 [[Clostridium] sordellii] [Paeniclostridium sordellii]
MRYNIKKGVLIQSIINSNLKIVEVAKQYTMYRIMFTDFKPRDYVVRRLSKVLKVSEESLIE